MSTPAYFFLALTVPVVVPLEEDSEVCVPHDDDAVPLFPEEETCSHWLGDDLDPSVVDEEVVLLFGDRKHARNTQDPADSTRNHTHCHRNGGLESRQQSSRDSFCTRCHPESVDEMPALADLDDERWLLLPATLVQNVADACAEVEWHHRWIVVVQSFLAPIFIVFAVGAFMTNLSVSSGGWFPGYMLGVVLGLVLALAMALYVRPDRHRSRVAAALVNDGEDTRVEVPWRTPFVALFGFVVGIVVCVWPSWMWMGGAIQPMLTSYIQWIFFIANELVGLLKSVGKILRISDSILGLTVLGMSRMIHRPFVADSHSTR